MAQVHTTRLTGSQIEHTTVKSIQQGDHVRVDRLQIPDGFVDLELDRIEILTPDAQLWVGTQDGLADLARPDVVILSGIVAGEADSIAYLAISPYGTNGFIERNGDLISISTGPYAQDQNLRESIQSVRMSDVLDANNATPLCGYEPGNVALEPSGPMIEYKPNPQRGASTCRIAGLAVETDYEFTSRLFSGNTNASAAYLVSLVGAISEIYQRDVNVRLAIPFLRVWGSNDDPYDPGAGDPLDLVRNEWNTNMTDVDRTLVHYFTGRQNTSYGGVAYLSVLCNSNFGYGVSAYLNGFFPYPLVDHNGANWDVVVASHELGHNFGTGHTHDSYSPVIDGCGNGDCSASFGGTIMSYCHSCSGGISNIVLNFHPRVIDRILGYLDSVNCNLISEGVSAVPDNVETLQNLSVDIDALSNDASQSCDAFMLSSVDSNSTQGGTIEVLVGQGSIGQDLFRYTPMTGFSGTDTFDYTIVGDNGMVSTTVTVDVRALRPADVRLDPLPGLTVKYYQLPNPSVLPDFDSLTPFATEVVSHVNYASTGGNFMNSGLADNVGAVLEGHVWAFIDGIYTLTTNSDDGSALYIGDELVVNNDGLHGMVKVGGTIPLSAGWHQIRIEFFERGGGAGLISTITGIGTGELELQGILLSHNGSAQCSIADLNADGIIDFFDISEFLSLFSSQDPIADFTNNGIWDFFDVSSFIQAYSAGCP